MTSPPEVASILGRISSLGLLRNRDGTLGVERATVEADRHAAWFEERWRELEPCVLAIRDKIGQPETNRPG